MKKLRWTLLISLAVPALWPNWYFSRPTTEMPGNDVLIAITTIAGVLWSGALIAFQVRKLLAEVTTSLSLLSFAVLAPVIVMITASPILRAVALVLGLYNLRAAIGSGIVFLIIRLIRLAVRSKRLSAPVSSAKMEAFDLIAGELRVGSIGNGLLFLCYALVFAWPSRPAIAWGSMSCVVLALVYTTEVLKPKYADLTAKIEKVSSTDSHGS
jgi:hypothetical protein